MNIVLLHAFPFDHRMWLDVAEAISQDGHEIALPDIRGLGEAPDWDDAEPARLSTVANDVIRMLDALGIEQAIIGGCSLGGYVSLEVLRNYPERVAGLLLADTKASADTEEQRKHRQQLIENIRSAQSLDPLLSGIERRMLDASSLDNADVMKTFHDMLTDLRIDGVCQLLDAMSMRDSYFEVLKNSAIPILSIRGESDGVSARAEHEAMIQNTPLHRHVEIQNAGHLAALEQPEAVAAIIREFLAASFT